MAARWRCCSGANGCRASIAATPTRRSRRPAMTFLRRERKALAHALAQQLDLENAPDLLAGEDADEIVGAGHGLAIDRDQHVARDQAGAPGRARRLDRDGHD